MIERGIEMDSAKNNQFLYNFNNPIVEMIVRKNNEELMKVIDFTYAFDSVVYNAGKAASKFEAYVNEMEKNDDYLQYLLDATYHLDYCIRLISSIDDLMNELIVKVYILINSNAQPFIGSKTHEVKKYIDTHISIDNHFKNILPSKGSINKNTGNIRHAITHNGQAFILPTSKYDDGIYTVYSLHSNVVKQQQKDYLNDIKIKLQKDLDNICVSVEKIDTILHPLLVDEESKVTNTH